MSHKAAKDDLLFFAKRFKGILELIPELEKISSLVDSIREKEQQLEVLVTEHKIAQEDLKTLKDRIKEWKQREEDSRIAAEKEATQIRKRAKDDARKIHQKTLSTTEEEIRQLLLRKEQTEQELKDTTDVLHTVSIDLHEQNEKLVKTQTALKKLKELI